MERVVLDGISYVRAADAAAQFGYTSDYIGQLCRGKKIDARLVGRSWYVNVDSIKEYRQAKHTKRKTRAAEKKRKKAKSNKVKINSPERRTTLAVHTDRQSSRKTPVKIVYETDTSELLPKVSVTRVQKEPVAEVTVAAKIATKQPEPVAEAPETEQFVDLGPLSGTSIPVEAEKVASIKVESAHKRRKPTKLVATELPTVVLKGTLNVSDSTEPAPEMAEDEDKKLAEGEMDDSANITKTKAIFYKISAILLWPLKIVWKFLFPARFIVRKVWQLARWLFKPVLFLWKKIPKKPKKKAKKLDKAVSFAPKAVKTQKTDKAALVPAVPTSNFHSRLAFLSLLLSAVLVSILVLSIGSQRSVNESSVEGTFYIDRGWFPTLLERL